MSPDSPSLAGPLERLLNSIETDRSRGARELTLHALKTLEQILPTVEPAGDRWTEFLRRLAGVRPAMAPFERIAVELAKSSSCRSPLKSVKELTQRMRSIRQTLLEVCRKEAPNPGFVATFSRSSTVRMILSQHPPEELLVIHSVPGGEGLILAQELEECGAELRFCYESELPHYQDEVDEVWVGADRIDPKNGVVNKVGTRLVFETFRKAHRAVIASTFKWSLQSRPLEVEARPGPTVLPEGLRGVHPTFERIPRHLVDVVWTERGPVRTGRQWGQVVEQNRQDLGRLYQEE